MEKHKINWKVILKNEMIHSFIYWLVREILQDFRLNKWIRVKEYLILIKFY